MESRTQRISNTCASSYRKWLGLLGGFLIFIPGHLPNVWGNMSVYVVSYFYAKYGLLSASSSWVLSLVFIGMYFGLFLNGFICLGPKMKIFLSVFLFCAGPFIMYLSLMCGYTEILFFATTLMGFCKGFSDSSVLKEVAGIAGDSSGTYISIACSGYSFGPFFINVFTSSFVNPDNLAPDFEADGIDLFSQNEVIEKVPSLFIILGTAYVVCRIIGFILLVQAMQWKKNLKKENDVSYSTFSEEAGRARIVTESDVRQHETIVSSGSHENVESLSLISSHSTNSLNIASIKSYDSDKDIIRQIITSEESVCTIHTSYSATHDTTEDDKNFSPLQTMKYLPFYALWFAYGSQLFPFVVMNNYYKTFGLNWIKDDHFLTKLGSAIAIAGGFFRLVWGIALDKLTIKTCLVSIYSCVGIVTTLIYFTPQINKWLYFSVSLVLGCGVFSILPSFVAVTMVYFGEKNFFKNLGMMSSSRLLVSFLLSPLFDVLLSKFGWFSIYACSASFVILSLILIVAFVPVKKANKS